MHDQRLQLIEREFLSIYPGGFEHPELLKIAKKHQISLRTEQARAYFNIDSFTQPQLVAQNMVTLISRSSMVSMFEKPRLKDWIKAMSGYEKESYALSLKDILHGDHEYGFNVMLSLLAAGRLAKWSLMTILPYYYKPQSEIFIKPTTTKGILQYFDIEEITYNPKPTFEFYTKYRKIMLRMKAQVDPSLQKDNAAFSGFLMMMTTP